LVAGSAVFGSADIGKAIAELRASAEQPAPEKVGPKA
jgi:hypothetical protein